MGVAQSKKYSKGNQGPQIRMDYEKQIQSQLKIITCWSLQQIRQMCVLYKNYSADCPYLSRFTFRKIIPFSNGISNQVFHCFGRGEKFISFYEFVCAVLLTAYNNYKRKLQFIYLVFNFMHEQSLKLKHFFIMYESMVFAFCRMTGQTPPLFQTLKKYLLEQYQTLESLEVQESNFQYRKLLEEVQMNSVARQLFHRFQGDVLGSKEKPFVYMLHGLAKYDKQSAENILLTIKKVYQQGNFKQVELQQKNKKFRLQNRRIQRVQQMQQNKSKELQKTRDFRIKDRSYSLKKLQEHGSKVTFNGYFTKPDSSAPRTYRDSLQNFFQSQSLTSRKILSHLNKSSHKNDILQTPQAIQKSKQLINRKLFQNKSDKQKLKKPSPLIFLGGKAYTKTNFFQTIQYFNTLSNNKEQIKIKEFFKTFQNKNFLRKQLSNLFQYFDKNCNGSISFQQFIKATYPNINNKFLQRVQAWNIDYKNIYQADKIVIKKENKNTKIQLPEDAQLRIKQIFLSFGGAKGYLSLQDIRTVYKGGFSVQQCQNVIKQFGRDGKIYIQSFGRMLLPQGFVIQNCNWHIKRS